MVKIYSSRVIPVMKHIVGPDVLDIGCVGMGENDVLGGADFIFGALHDKFPGVIGIDINAEGVQELNDKGFKAVVHDAQEPYTLHKKFDTVVSEENIEHISNLKTYLDNVRNHIKEGGRFVMSTPNAVCLDFMFQTFLFGKPRVNQHHTHVHTLDTITYLLESNGFKVIHHEYIQAFNPSMNFNSKIWKWVVRWFPKRFGRTLIVVAEVA